MIDTVVWDLGGVLVDWDPRHLYRSVFTDADEMERFLREVCTLEWHFHHDAGVPFEESIPARCAEFPDHAELIRLWSTRYMDMVAGEIEDAVAVLRDLDRRGVRQLALTNMPDEVDRQLRERFDWFALFDGVVVSGTERVVKPDPEIYRILVDRYDVEPQRAAFVDDRSDNVAAARALGFEAILFTDAAAVRAALDAQIPR